MWGAVRHSRKGHEPPKPFRDALESQSQISSTVLTVNTLIETYRAEKMPKCEDTRCAYKAWSKVGRAINGASS